MRLFVKVPLIHFGQMQLAQTMYAMYMAIQFILHIGNTAQEIMMT